LYVKKAPLALAKNAVYLNLGAQPIIVFTGADWRMAAFDQFLTNQWRRALSHPEFPLAKACYRAFTVVLGRVM
jgi:hypothetical protein